MSQREKRWSFSLVSIWKVLRAWKQQRKAWKEIDKDLKKAKKEYTFVPRPWGVMDEEWSDPEFRASYGKAPGV